MSDKTPVKITKGTAKELGIVIRQRKARLSPIVQMKRRTYDSLTIDPMIVTEVQNVNTLIGKGQNVDVNSWYVSDGGVDVEEKYTFEAKPYEVSASSIKDLSGEAVQIACRVIPTVLFTGQLFLFASTGEFFENGKIFAEGDIIGAVDGNRWRGYVTTDPPPNRSGSVSSYYVDVPYNQKLSNPKATGITRGVSRNFYCRVLAYNNTGVQLSNGQKVMLDYTPNYAFDGDVVATGSSRWVISEYTCSTITGLVTG